MLCHTTINQVCTKLWLLPLSMGFSFCCCLYFCYWCLCAIAMSTSSSTVVNKSNKYNNFHKSNITRSGPPLYIKGQEPGQRRPINQISPKKSINPIIPINPICWGLGHAWTPRAKGLGWIGPINPKNIINQKNQINLINPIFWGLGHAWTSRARSQAGLGQ